MFFFFFMPLIHAFASQQSILWLFFKRLSIWLLWTSLSVSCTWKFCTCLQKENKEIQEVYVNNYLQIMTYHFTTFVNFRYFLQLWNQKNDGWCSKRDFYSCGAKLKKFISSKILILKECLQCLYNPSFPFLGRSYSDLKCFFVSM